MKACAWFAVVCLSGCVVVAGLAFCFCLFFLPYQMCAFWAKLNGLQIAAAPLAVMLCYWLFLASRRSAGLALAVARSRIGRPLESSKIKAVLIPKRSDLGSFVRWLFAALIFFLFLFFNRRMN